MDPKNMAILSMMGGPMMHQGGQMGITPGMIEMSRRNIPVLKSPSGPLAEQPTPFKMSDSEMKAKIAYQAAMGNKSAQRMSQLYPNTYTFTGQEMDAYFNQPMGVPQGETGTHFMTSMGNSAVPFIQQGQEGLYFNENPNPSNPEAIQFENPEQALYFSENYKKVAPMMRNTK
jgi:hypothetical protein